MRWKTPVALVAIMAFLAIHDLCVAEVDVQPQDAKEQDVAEMQYYHDDDGYYHGPRGNDHNRDPSREPTYYKHKHTVWVHPGPPGPPGLTCATAEKCPYVQVQNELLSALLFQSIDQARRLAALEGYVFGSQPVPFNKTECLARGVFNTTFAPNTTSKWVVLNFDTSSNDATRICRGQYGQAPTCSAICGAQGLKCDACGMMQTSCPSQLFQAMAWAGADLETLRLDPDTYFGPPNSGPPFADPNGCPSSANDTAGGPFYLSLLPFTPANVAYAKSLGNAQALCDLGTEPVFPTNFYPAMKNMVDPSQNYTYLDPQTACNAPIWDFFSLGSSLPTFVQFSALCYCNGALQGV